MYDKEHTVAFTGHRPHAFIPQYIQEYNEIPDTLVQLIYGEIESLYLYEACRHFISGGALGWDMWSAFAVFQLKNKYPEVRLTIARPFPSQDAKWSRESKRIYNDVLLRADEVVDTSDDPYFAWKLMFRNKWMVDRCSYLIAGKRSDITTGGTAACINYARIRKVEVLELEF
jgi:uncharacterized phage-like protein YoqJ